MMRVVLGLGGNLGKPEAAFAQALEALAGMGRVAAVSRLWRSRPIGPSQPDFLNAAALLDWPAGPRSLLDRCLELEAVAGRDRAQEERWGPRPLDLDLLLAEAVVCRGPTLDLPHPRFHNRRFALEPAFEVAPEWTHPILGCTVTELVHEARGRDPEAIISTMLFGN